MKFLTGILLSALSLTLSTVALANNFRETRYLLDVTDMYGYEKLPFGPIHTLEGYQIIPIYSNRDRSNIGEVSAGLRNSTFEYVRSMKIPKEEQSKKFSEIMTRYEFSIENNTIYIPSEKTQLFLTNKKNPTIEEICASEKGKANNAFEKCIGK